MAVREYGKMRSDTQVPERYSATYAETAAVGFHGGNSSLHIIPFFLVVTYFSLFSFSLDTPVLVGEFFSKATAI